MPLLFFSANCAFLLQSAGYQLSSEIWAMVEGGGKVSLEGCGRGFPSRRSRLLVRALLFKWELFTWSMRKILSVHPSPHPFFFFFFSNHNVNAKENKHFLLYCSGFIVLIALSISQSHFKVFLPFHFTYGFQFAWKYMSFSNYIKTILDLQYIPIS